MAPCRTTTMTEDTIRNTIDIRVSAQATTIDEQEPYKSILKYVRKHPGSRIPEIADATAASWWTTRGRLYRLSADGLLRVERFLNVPFFFIAKVEP